MNYTNPYMTAPRFQTAQPSWNPGQVVLDTNQAFSPQQPNAFNWVQGIEAVKSYPMAPGTKMAFFDSEAPRVYIKSVDVTGKPMELEIYDLVKYEPAKEETLKDAASDYLTLEIAKDLIPELIKKEVEKALSNMSLKPSSGKKKKGDDD